MALYIRRSLSIWIFLGLLGLQEDLVECDASACNLVKVKVSLLHGCFPCLLNCTNGTKSRKASQIVKQNQRSIFKKKVRKKVKNKNIRNSKKQNLTPQTYTTEVNKLQNFWLKDSSNLLNGKAYPTVPFMFCFFLNEKVIFFHKIIKFLQFKHFHQVRKFWCYDEY